MEKAGANRTEALRDLEFIRSLVFDAREGARGTAPFLILWGAIWLIGYLMPLVTDFAPIHNGEQWAFLAPAGGIASFFIGSRIRGPVPFLLKVVFVSWLVLGGFGLVTLFYLVPGANASAMTSFWPLLIGSCYLVGGAVLGRELLAVGALLVVLSLVGVNLPLEYQALLYGLGGGGALLLSGLALRKGAPAHGR